MNVSREVPTFSAEIDEAGTQVMAETVDKDVKQ